MATHGNAMLCTIEELRKICLFSSAGIQELPTTDYDEVYPGILLGNVASASDVDKLRKLGVGYVLNSAYGPDRALNMIEALPPEEYGKAGIVFLGIPAIDMMSFPLRDYFSLACEFIRDGLASGKKVLVHCKQGISRSAALVLAYLVQEVGLEVQEATRMVRKQREIFPNDGFLQQLCELNELKHKK
ncbi:dual specificity protein phosphatase 3-like isoform X2 [Stegodyphus dumicola]|uniref:dual specificity protein phosphatase 3-like isoform X2 n=1 Tax=Stegodyphus dumicola TaxID=202533 RepID=UPI0015A760E6|nr:dual specificity protein phosphatase 3-like isoform X2 [Stegodyphus dumicola]